MIDIRRNKLLDDVISPVKSAFVPGRLITDNIFVAYESMHTIKNKKKGNKKETRTTTLPLYYSQRILEQIMGTITSFTLSSILE